MKLIVKEVFQDVITKQYYKVGQQIEISEKERVKDMTDRGLAEVVKEAKPKKK